MIWAHRRRASSGKPCKPPPAAVPCYGGSPCSAAVVPLGGQSPFARLRRTRPSLKKKNPRAGTHGGQPFQTLNQPRCAEPKGFLPENQTHTAFGQRRNTNPIPRKRPSAHSNPARLPWLPLSAPAPKGAKPLRKIRCGGGSQPQTSAGRAVAAPTGVNPLAAGGSGGL